MYYCETHGCDNTVVVLAESDLHMIVLCDDCKSARSEELKIVHAMLELDY